MGLQQEIPSHEYFRRIKMFNEYTEDTNGRYSKVDFKRLMSDPYYYGIEDVDYEDMDSSDTQPMDVNGRYVEIGIFDGAGGIRKGLYKKDKGNIDDKKEEVIDFQDLFNDMSDEEEDVFGLDNIYDDNQDSIKNSVLMNDDTLKSDKKLLASLPIEKDRVINIKPYSLSYIDLSILLHIKLHNYKHFSKKELAEIFYINDTNKPRGLSKIEKSLKNIIKTNGDLISVENDLIKVNF